MHKYLLFIQHTFIVHLLYATQPEIQQGTKYMYVLNTVRLGKLSLQVDILLET